MNDNACTTLLNGRVKLYQPDSGFRVAIDTVLLAAATRAESGQKILDMGAGVGGVTFCLNARISGLKITGVELQEPYHMLSLKNKILNKTDDDINFLLSDINKIDSSFDAKYDHVICNPPFLDQETYMQSPNKEKDKAIGNSEQEMTIADWVHQANRRLKPGGCFTMVHRADYIQKIISSLAAKFGGTEIIPLWPKQQKEAKRVIIRTYKGKKSPSVIKPGLILHEADGSYTHAANAVLREAAPLL